MRRLCSVLPALLILACGDKTPQPAPQKAEKKETKEPVVEAPPVKEDVPSETDGLDPFDGDWGSEEGGEEPAAEEGGEVDAGEAPPDPFAGPCKISWSTGAVLRFKYTETGGTVRVDEDGDKKADACGAFESKDGKTTSMKIDEGCNKKNDITIEPEYDAKANVATATVKDGTITLVTIPGYTGLTPGYPLYADRKSARVKVKKGLVKSADVKKPWDGPPMKVVFTYDKQGRVTRIKEDHERDGSTDRRFDYRYDKAGNVVRINVVIGSGDAQQKGRARLSYACHKSE